MRSIDVVSDWWHYQGAHVTDAQYESPWVVAHGERDRRYGSGERRSGPRAVDQRRLGVARFGDGDSVGRRRSRPRPSGRGFCGRST